MNQQAVLPQAASNPSLTSFFNPQALSLSHGGGNQQIAAPGGATISTPLLVPQAGQGPFLSTQGRLTVQRAEDPSAQLKPRQAAFIPQLMSLPLASNQPGPMQLVAVPLELLQSLIPGVMVTLVNHGSANHDRNGDENPEKRQRIEDRS